jgi:hypothetical protein
MMERKRTATAMNYLKKTQPHAAPVITKEKGMHASEVEVQTIKGTCEKEAEVGGEMDIEKPMSAEELLLKHEDDKLVLTIVSVENLHIH